MTLLRRLLGLPTLPPARKPLFVYRCPQCRRLAACLERLNELRDGCGVKYCALTNEREYDRAAREMRD